MDSMGGFSGRILPNGKEYVHAGGRERSRYMEWLTSLESSKSVHVWDSSQETTFAFANFMSERYSRPQQRTTTRGSIGRPLSRTKFRAS